jgi:hypothetical protein
LKQVPPKWMWHLNYLPLLNYLKSSYEHMIYSFVLSHIGTETILTLVLWKSRGSTLPTKNSVTLPYPEPVPYLSHFYNLCHKIVLIICLHLQVVPLWCSNRNFECISHFPCTWYNLSVLDYVDLFFIPFLFSW